MNKIRTDNFKETSYLTGMDSEPLPGDETLDHHPEDHEPRPQPQHEPAEPAELRLHLPLHMGPDPKGHLHLLHEIVERDGHGRGADQRGRKNRHGGETDVGDCTEKPRSYRKITKNKKKNIANFFCNNKITN